MFKICACACISLIDLLVRERSVLFCKKKEIQFKKNNRAFNEMIVYYSATKKKFVRLYYIKGTMQVIDHTYKYIKIINTSVHENDNIICC